MKTNFQKYLFIITILLFIPFITHAGVWEQSTQAELERGSIQGDALITDEEIRMIPGVIYEDAEDENTDDWRVFDNDPEGTITNLFDPERSSRIINLASSNPIESIQTGFDYGHPARIVENLQSIEWKMKTTADSRVYVVLNTLLGTRSMTYGPGVSTGTNALYIRHSLGVETGDGNWHTIRRNLQDDIHSFEPENEMSAVRFIAMRGNMDIDDIYIIPENATYTSPILDLGENRVASFNRIIWDEEVPEDTSLSLQTRTSTNGSTWSEWSREYNDSAGERITSTPQRYFQYKANLNNNSNITSIPRLRRTLIEYNRAPNITENLLPVNDRELSNTDNLTWNATADPDTEDSVTYTLEIDNNNDFGSLDSVTSGIVNTEININQLENFTNLQDDTRYYWRIKTVDNQNNQSDYSAEEKYFILDKENQAPNAPDAGFNPNQGGIVKTQKPTIYWSAASDPDDADTKETLSYVIQIDENNKFNSANIYNTNRTNFTLPENLEDNTQYYYRIKTKDDEEANSAWSVVQNFVIATGKNPIIVSSKTVGINVDSNEQSSVMLGFINNNINFSKFEYIYWLAIILIIAVAFFYLNKKILFNHILAPSYNKNSPNKKHNTNFLFAKSIRSLDGVKNNSKKVITEVKGSRTKTIIAIIILVGIIALTLAGIYYYDDNPSPYKDDGKNVKIGDELTYRIDFKNEGESNASNFNILDNIPEGTSYIENSVNINGDPQTDTNDSDLLTLASNKLKFKFGEITTKNSGYITFKVKVEGIPENHKIENTADLLYGESDGVQNTNQTINYIENGTSSISSIEGIVWNDNNNNKLKDENEDGVGDIIVKIYKDINSDNILGEEDGLYLNETNTNSTGNYQFKNITKGNYFVTIGKENLPIDSLVSTDNNPQLITVEEIKKYTDINFGIRSTNDQIVDEIIPSPKGIISGSVWKDQNKDGYKNINEVGLEKINIKLYEDSNNNNTLEFDQDLYVSLLKTDSNGNYKITGLSPNKYLILVEENTLVASEFKLTTPNNPVVVSLETEDQEYSNTNFGYFIKSAIGGSREDETPLTDNGYNEVLEIVTSEEDLNKSDTISFAPTIISEESQNNKITPPTLTHLGPAQINNYDTNFSLPINNDLVLKGKTGSNFTVTLFIHSELNLKTVTSANQEGIWEMTVNTSLFEAGEHKVYAQSQDNEGNISSKVEIAHFRVNKDEKIIEQFNYWIALLGLVVIAATIILTTWIRERGKDINKPKKKTKSKTKSKLKTSKNSQKTPIKKPKNTRRKIKVK